MRSTAPDRPGTDEATGRAEAGAYPESPCAALVAGLATGTARRRRIIRLR
jgi:hypothetical protein